MDRNIHTIKKNTKALLVTSKESGLDINTYRTKCMVMSQGQDVRQNHNIKIDNKSFEKVEQLKYLGTTLTNQNSVHKEIKSRCSH